MLCLASAGLAQQLVTIDTSYVGNPGNAADSADGDIHSFGDDNRHHFGKVDYTFNIGTYDVTLTQYTALLNAVAKTDQNGLFNTNMAADPAISGISRSGNAGNYSYSVMGDGQRPVTLVSWADGARFCNWLQNGQPASGVEDDTTTETGAYSLNGDVTNGMQAKNPLATWWIPSEDEWYKAAYYDPTLNDGTGGYWTYATRSNTVPGNSWMNRTLANTANYYNGGGSYTLIGISGYLTPVGTFTNSASFYGVYDLTGNVWNWNDAAIGSYRGLRGGSWADFPNYLASSYRDYGGPTYYETASVGFRVATSTPEPDSILLLGIGSAVLSFRRWRNRNIKP